VVFIDLATGTQHVRFCGAGHAEAEFSLRAVLYRGIYKELSFHLLISDWV
jgi:hypothetical protein